MPEHRTSLLLGVLLLSSLSCFGAGTSSATAIPACTSPQLSLHTDGKDGCFNGMSHSGTMVVLKNTSAHACTLQPFPTLAFKDKHHRPLQIQLTLDTPFTRPHTLGTGLAMGHGPVALPVPVPPGAQATFALRWVSGEVYDKNVCRDPAYLVVRSGTARKQSPFGGHVCGPDAAHIAITATRLSTDPSAQPCH